MTAVRGRAIIRGGGWRAGWGRGRFRVESAVGMGVVGRWLGVGGMGSVIWSCEEGMGWVRGVSTSDRVGIDGNA